MSEIIDFSESGYNRFQRYIEKIATGPRQSKDLSREEAKDALILILNGDITPVRAAIFLIAARMKRETLEENLGYWEALDEKTIKYRTKVKNLLQVAEPFDGFNRSPCFGFFAIPVIASLGLPCYGHSSLTLPPKRGVTFQEILHRHYNTPLSVPIDVSHLEEKGFCYVGIGQSHPKLEALRGLREEMVKRSVLATFEKMLMPLIAQDGVNILSTSYFHKGYEVPMIAAARASGFEKTIIGNGLESTTLFGVHKPTTLFRICNDGEINEQTVDVRNLLEKKDSENIQGAYRELKGKKTELTSLALLGEQALLNGKGPAAPLIAWQTGSLVYLSGLCSSFKEGFQAAETILKKGEAFSPLMSYLERGLKSTNV